MAEQKTDLEEAIKVFKTVENFEDYRGGLRSVLTRCHTQEELERARLVIDEVKERLMENNPEFKAIMDQRKAELKRQSEYDRAIHKAKMAEAKAEAYRARSEAMAKVQSVKGVNGFIAKARARNAPIEDLENESELYCPICQERDTSNNIVNNERTCMKCMHKLVPKSELSKYNRKYRRAWKRK